MLTSRPLEVTLTKMGDVHLGMRSVLEAASEVASLCGGPRTTQRRLEDASEGSREAQVGSASPPGRRGAGSECYRVIHDHQTDFEQSRSVLQSMMYDARS